MPIKKEVMTKRVSRVERVPRVPREVKPRDTSKPRGTSLSVPVYSLAGNAAGTLSLPKEIFGQKVNKKLLSQAIRVYTTNQKTLSGSTKTRGEVEGSTAKIYRQKGTGRARHGAIRAPIFVGGGIIFGPKYRQVRLDLPKKMKKAALLSALSAKAADQGILGISGMEKASGKTKEMVKLMEKLKAKNALIVTGGQEKNVVRAVRNIPGISVLSVNMINAYEVLKHEMLLIAKDAVEKLVEGTTRGTGTTSTTGAKTRGTRDTHQSRDTLSL